MTELERALHALAGGFRHNPDADPTDTSLRTHIQFVTNEAMERAFGPAINTEGIYGDGDGYAHEWRFSDIRTGLVFTVYDRFDRYRICCLSSISDRRVSEFVEWLHTMLGAPHA